MDRILGGLGGLIFTGNGAGFTEEAFGIVLIAEDIEKLAMGLDPKRIDIGLKLTDTDLGQLEGRIGLRDGSDSLFEICDIGAEIAFIIEAKRVGGIEGLKNTEDPIIFLKLLSDSDLADFGGAEIGKEELIDILMTGSGDTAEFDGAVIGFIVAGTKEGLIGDEDFLGLFEGSAFVSEFGEDGGEGRCEGLDFGSIFFGEQAGDEIDDIESEDIEGSVWS